MKVVAHAVLLGFFVFLGITGISLGLGALAPKINMIAKPFLCAEGDFNHKKIISRPLPGTTYVESEWVCIQKKGQKQQVSPYRVALVAGSFHGLGLYLLFVLMVRLLKKSRPSST